MKATDQKRTDDKGKGPLDRTRKVGVPTPPDGGNATTSRRRKAAETAVNKDDVDRAAEGTGLRDADGHTVSRPKK